MKTSVTSTSQITSRGTSRSTAFYWISLLTTALTWPLIAFGAIVRLKGAGLACPDWPLCYGKILPPPGFEIALEVGHRFVAGVVGLLILGMVFLAYRLPQNKEYRRLSLAILALVLVQGVLGGLTVLMKLWPPTVILHLVGGNLLFGCLVGITYMAYRKEKAPEMKETLVFKWSRFSKWQASALALFFVILISGGANSSTYSGYACEAFPGCHAGSPLSFSLAGETVAGTQFAPIPKDLEGHFLPRYQNEWIHMLHRVIAIFGGLFLIGLVWKTLVRHSDVVYRRVGEAIVALIILEMVVGIANAIYRIPVPVSALHTAIAASIVGLLSFSIVKSIYGTH